MTVSWKEAVGLVGSYAVLLFRDNLMVKNVTDLSNFTTNVKLNLFYRACRCFWRHGNWKHNCNDSELERSSGTGGLVRCIAFQRHSHGEKRHRPEQLYYECGVYGSDTWSALLCGSGHHKWTFNERSLKGLQRNLACSCFWRHGNWKHNCNDSELERSSGTGGLVRCIAFQRQSHGEKRHRPEQLYYECGVYGSDTWSALLCGSGHHKWTFNERSLKGLQRNLACSCFWRHGNWKHNCNDSELERSSGTGGLVRCIAFQRQSHGEKRHRPEQLYYECGVYGSDTWSALLCGSGHHKWTFNERSLKGLQRNLACRCFWRHGNWKHNCNDSELERSSGTGGLVRCIAFQRQSHGEKRHRPQQLYYECGVYGSDTWECFTVVEVVTTSGPLMNAASRVCNATY
uniref:uncharacterized protein LOC120809194 n=1 Tax=Gasterosteus aculeatus aculeatus TaxID=481459 RepID=UPI001A99AF71|nr:uncharacterized protein LOC120809194 [Gasterosteus aculeatus aculeatus]